MNRGLPGVGDMLRSASPLLGTPPASQTAVTASVEIPTFRDTIQDRALAPRPSDVAFDEKHFDSVSEPLRTELVEAWRAYRARQYQRALEILYAADPNNPRVLLVRGIATIALSGAEPLRDGLALLRRASDLGEPRAAALLGVLKIGGAPGLARDIDGGKQLLERASAAGDAAAARVIGNGYLSGWMGTVDPGRAAQYLRLASDRGDTGAMMSLAELLFQGRGVTKNHQDAERLLLRAAEADRAEAQALLGTWRLTGYLAGMTDNPEDALYWLGPAVGQGDPHGMENFGMVYVEYGKRTNRAGIPRGVELFRRCAEATLFPDCAFAYATALDNGLGVIRDPVRAYAMYVLSTARNSNPKAKGRMDELAKSLSAADLTSAHAIASQMLSKPRSMRPNGLPW